MAARHPVRVTAAAVVSDHDEALEPELAHDRDLIGGQGGLAAAHFRPWSEGCERPWSRCRGSRSPEGRSDRITLPCSLGEVLDVPRHLQRTPGAPRCASEGPLRDRRLGRSEPRLRGMIARAR
jgi:hypothetical protein